MMHKYFCCYNYNRETIEYTGVERRRQSAPDALGKEDVGFAGTVRVRKHSGDDEAAFQVEFVGVAVQIAYLAKRLERIGVEVDACQAGQANLVIGAEPER